MKIAQDVSAGEGLVLLAAVGVGIYMIYTLLQTLEKGPGQVLDWAEQELSDAGNAIGASVGEGALSEESGENMYADPGFTQ